MSYPVAAGNWSNPPPPGTCQADSEASSNASFDEYQKKVVTDRCAATDDTQAKKERDSNSRSHRPDKRRSRQRRSRSRSRHKHRRRSTSRSDSSDRDGRRTRRSRHGRSRSRSHRRHYKHKRNDSKRSRSSSRSSRSKDRRRSKKTRYSRSSSECSSGGRYRHRRRRRSRERSELKESLSDQDESGPSQENSFKNDGSFLEMFKKLQEQQATSVDANSALQVVDATKKPTLPVFGKRRGGRVLKTGLVQKNKLNKDTDDDEPKDAWSIYMKEVKRYKEACCDDDSKTRPLVK